MTHRAQLLAALSLMAAALVLLRLTSDAPGVAAGQVMQVRAAPLGSERAYARMAANPKGVGHAYRFMSSAAGYVDRLNVYVDHRSSASALEVALYDGARSQPRTRRAHCVITAPRRGAWNRCAVRRLALRSGRPYWLVLLQPAGASGRLRYRVGRVSGAPASRLSKQKRLGALPSTWRSDARRGGHYEVSVFAAAAAEPPAPSPVGITPAPTPTPPAAQALGATPTPDLTESSQPTPTPTPTPDPTVTEGPCASATPNVPDGPDPWGGCFPGPSNTGVPEGTVLSSYTGPCRITDDNTVIDSKKIDCDIDIAANNVQIKNSFISGGVLNDVRVVDDVSTVGSFNIEDSTVDAGPIDLPDVTGIRALCCQHFTAARVDLMRGYSGAWCEYYCTITDSWIHAGDTDEGGAAHESGVRQGSGITPRAQSFVHNSIRCEADIVLPDGGCSADVTGYGNFDTIRNNYLYRNLLQDTPSGAYCVYGGSTVSMFPDGADNEWRSNVFQRGPSGLCGTYGPTTDFDAGLRRNVFEDNHWDSGELIADPQ